MEGLCSSSLLFSVLKHSQKNMRDLLSKAQKYMNTENVAKAMQGESYVEGNNRWRFDSGRS